MKNLSLKTFVETKVLDAIKKAIDKKELGGLTLDNEIKLVIEKPKNEEFGDFAINVSSLARFAKLAPAVIAQNIAQNIEADDVEITVVAGFINFKLGKSYLNNILVDILQNKNNFAKSDLGKKEKVLLEYVSANPTGPFHIGHGRWAAMGSALANLMNYAGYDVTQEFYINDAGVQVKNLGRSLHIRVLQEKGVNIDFPTDEIEAKKYYAGDYLIEVAKAFVKEQPAATKELSETLTDEQLQVLCDFARLYLLNLQKELLANFKTNFDNFYSELDLHKSGKVEKGIEQLKEKNMLFEQDGAVWFKSSQFGDDQDRVIKKSDGNYTYLTADIAYHYNKFDRGFERLINIWGADHHGYIPRMKAALDASGYDSNKMEVLLGQLVNLVVNGEQVRMGKRKKMVTLDDLIEEVGVDATRYWMIMRSIDTALDFDIELAKSKTDDNPVFYAQYAHARACSILRNATTERIDTELNTSHKAMFDMSELEKDFSNYKRDDFNQLWENVDEDTKNATKKILLKIEELKFVVETAARGRAPYHLCKYLQELAATFHHFYTVVRVISDDKELTKKRLALVSAIRTALATVFEIIAVDAPQRM